VGGAILIVNVTANAIAMSKIIAIEKQNNNIDSAAWKESGLYIGAVEFFALNNIMLLKYLPWKRVPYQGYASRNMFAICSLSPLALENVPQLILQADFAFAAAELEWNDIASMVTTAMSVILCAFTKGSFAFVANNQTMVAPTSESERKIRRTHPS